MNDQEDAINLGSLLKVYFDTSAWNHLSDRADRKELIHEIRRSDCIVLASVISVGEVLCIEDVERRQLICSTICSLHGDGHILERPQEILSTAAEAFIRGDKDMTLPRTGPGDSLDSYMRNPLSVTSGVRQSITAWLREMERSLEEFIRQIKRDEPDGKTKYCSPAVLERKDFLEALCQIPPAQRFALSVAQVSQLCDQWGVWRAFAATVACIIELSASHAPKHKQSKTRPGGPDLWQLVYLGISEVFVTDDGRMRDAAREVSDCMRYPRRVMSLEDFEGALTRHKDQVAPSG